ncbi:tRNA threonylcarbamoyladenosine dehydratase [Adlercreutzia sp. R25]|uniref:tRNA threonylcarbamoyladenosine dehydratase n=1 Tax=Adlercreutzia shanghongiae TaxID=3111773 RepID=A0ABU6IXN3_9ACTN|nr:MULTISPECIES: tRNA threonylcarbamoyladenosine dehydratase [unclassified Adlercreutzia]MEC4272485.1 tRNA threonylcarbamoyladenosine dehydratase [Adlercreutzia sp. R25]MEC4294615.1 tRNA threonylcarbamoyladenosine dehydratase [Adlercreutzia sp. R22]
MDDIYARTRLLLGDEALERLAAARVAVFGVGGVGGYAVEALARSGVGALDLVDSDNVDPTNLNRQIVATTATVGRPKVEAAAERVRSINPACEVRPHQCFFLPETASQFDFAAYDYVIDAVDTVSAKIALVEAARAAVAPIVSSMGAGNKLDPTAFRVADIYETSVDPLARVMRRELRRRGIPALKVVYSTEPPLTPEGDDLAVKDGTRLAPGSIAFVPSVAGLILGGEVVKDLAGTAQRARGAAQEK